MSTVVVPRKLSSSAADFIDEAKLAGLVARKADPSAIREIIAKSMTKEPLALDETAVLLSADSPDLIEEIYDAARQLKRDVYGNRIVLFAPLYVGNECTNDCVTARSAAPTARKSAARSARTNSAARSRPCCASATSG